MPRRAAIPDQSDEAGALSMLRRRAGLLAGTMLALAVAGMIGILVSEQQRLAPSQLRPEASGAALAEQVRPAHEWLASASAPIVTSPMAPDDADAATAALLDEVRRLLQMADRLDADIDRLMHSASGPTPIPDWPVPVTAVAIARFLPFPHSRDGMEMAVVAPAETAALVAMPRAVLALPPEPVPGVPPTERLTAIEPDAGTGPAAAPPVLRAASRRLNVAAPAVMSQAMLPTAQRRCTAITLRVQLGEEPSHADQRFLQSGCR